MSAKIVPNTFQCFNVYVDRAMQHLTDSELRVLLYATRHILGWQDKITSRRARISLSMFVNGYSGKNEDGTECFYAGCGLGEAAVRSACNSLVKFGFLKRVGKLTEKGQGWQIGDKPDWGKLEARTAERLQKQKQQVEKATAAGNVRRKGVTSNDTPTSNVRGQVTSNDTPGVTSNDTQTKPSQSHLQNQEENARAQSADESQEVTPSEPPVFEQPPSKPSQADSSAKTPQPPNSARPPSPGRKRFTLAVRVIEDKYADGSFIDVGTPDFLDACNGIFYAWFDALEELGRRPDTSLLTLWDKNRDAIKALAQNRRTPEQVAAFVRYAYSDKFKDDFWRRNPAPISLQAVTNAIAGWLSNQKPKQPISFEEHQPLYPPRQQFTEEEKARIRQIRAEAFS